MSVLIEAKVFDKLKPWKQNFVKESHHRIKYIHDNYESKEIGWHEDLTNKNLFNSSNCKLHTSKIEPLKISIVGLFVCMFVSYKQACSETHAYKGSVILV